VDGDVAEVLDVVAGHTVPDPEVLFTVFGDVYDELQREDGEVVLDRFSRLFGDRATMEGFGDAGEAVVRHLADRGGIDAVRKVREERVDALVSEYRQRLVEPAGEAGENDAWQGFLAEYGPSWNGDEAAWGQFVDWFQHYATENGVGTSAQGFLAGAEGSPDRVAYFAQYGITIERPEAAAVESPEAWNGFLAEYGPSWNGDEAAWGQFVDWFQHYATENGVGTSAQGFLAGAEGSPDKIDYFAAYGITVERPAPDEQRIEEARATMAATVTGSAAVPDELSGPILQAFEDVLKELPEIAELTGDELRQLAEDVAADLRA
jgi:hypothetical protein